MTRDGGQCVRRHRGDNMHVGRPDGRAPRLRGTVLVGAAVCALLALLIAPPALGRAPAPRGVVDLPVQFHVQNINRSKLSCSASGEPVTLVGRLVAPAALLSAPDTPANVTLYLHEFSFGKWFWHFPDPAYDYATIEAEAGHVSVLVDRLGYGDSTHPNGFATCLGADADEEHQMVMQLRAGTYQLQGAPARRFSRVVLAGHSGGAMDSEIAAYSFGEVDGLMIFAHADENPTLLGLTEASQEGAVCGIGGQPSYPKGPGGYAYFGQTDTQWVRDYFSDADPRIVSAAVPLRHRDPCGDVDSFVQGAFVNHMYDRDIKVPVLLLYGLSDALFAQPSAGYAQRQLFTGTSDVTLQFFPGAGHALTLQHSAPHVRSVVSHWLDEHGLG